MKHSCVILEYYYLENYYALHLNDLNDELDIKSVGERLFVFQYIVK